MDTVVSGVGVETVAYHEDTETVRTRFDQEKTAASTAVVATLAEVTGTDVVDMDPLHDSVDPEALDSAVRVRDGTEGDVHVTFTHEDHEISVYSYGLVRISAERGPPSGNGRRNAGR